MALIFQITMNNLRNIPRRLGESLVVCLGIACVVGVLVTALSLATTMSSGIGATGQPDRALVLREGAITESLSSISREDIARLEAMAGIVRGEGGHPGVSPEILMSVSFIADDEGTDSIILIRGMTTRGFEIRPEIVLTEGRMFSFGKHEVVVGRFAHEEFSTLTIDNQLWINGVAWMIVGVFTSNGDAHESELLADESTLRGVANGIEYSSATVKLTEFESFDDFRSAVATIPGTNLKALRESEYYKGQSETISNIFFLLAYVVSTIMALGATCGSLNIMYSVVDARAVEIATLRAIGFGSMPIVISILVEAMLLGFVGACAGASVAWIFFNGGTFTTEQYLGVGASINHLVFSVEFTPQLVVMGIVCACVIGLLGALFPALQSTRGPIAPGLRVT
jgi:putative ABC transport system permease protein